MSENAGAQGHETDIHFLRAVTDMAEHTEVMTGDAIYTDKGMKLVELAEGVSFDEIQSKTGVTLLK